MLLFFTFYLFARKYGKFLSQHKEVENRLQSQMRSFSHESLSAGGVLISKIFGNQGSPHAHTLSFSLFDFHIGKHVRV